MPIPEEIAGDWPRLQAPTDGFFVSGPGPSEVADENGWRVIRPRRYGVVVRWGFLLAIGVPLFWLGWRFACDAGGPDGPPAWVVRGVMPLCLVLAWGGIAYAVEKTHRRNLKLGPVIQWHPGENILSFPRAALHGVPLGQVVGFHFVKGVFNVGERMDMESAIEAQQLWVELLGGKHVCIFSGGYMGESRMRKLLADELDRPLALHRIPKESFVVVRGWSNC